MEALAAVSLAGTAVQFVSFTSDLISKAGEIHSSATGYTDDGANLESVYEKLRALSVDLQFCSTSSQTVAPQLETHVAAIQELAIACKEDCDKLLGILRKLASADRSKNAWQSSKVAWKAFWKLGKLKELEGRLIRTQRTLTLEICVITSVWHSLHEESLARLHSESERLHLQHSAKLDMIEQTLESVKSHMEANENSANGHFSYDDISMLTGQMAAVKVSEETIAREQCILLTLNYESRPARHASIPEAHMKTFRWVFDKQSSRQTAPANLLRWLEKGSGIFWVSGKPGCGKSTFMKFVADQLATRRALNSWSAPKRVVIASHYFWSAGTEMQKSHEGMLRSLLCQIFQQCPELIQSTCGARWSQMDESKTWTLRDLQTVFKEIANLEASPVKFCFFIDGLDEYNGDHFEFCQFLKGLSISPHIKLCISSRSWNVFEEALGEDATRKFYLHDITKNDIQQYAQSRLEEHPRWASVSGKLKGVSLVNEITQRSSGVFLWVFLVTKLLRESLTNRDSVSDLHRRLVSFPTELGPFFRQILESVDSFYHNRMAATLQIALAAPDPLHMSIYTFHDQEYDDPDYALNMPLRTMEAKEMYDSYEEAAWRLNSRCHGLLEVNQAMWHVGFLHRTVFDFLRTREMSDFLAAKTPPDFVPALSTLKAYIARIKSTKFAGVTKREPQGVYHGSSFKFLLEKAMASVMEIEENSSHRTTATYRLLDDLETSILQMQDSGEANLDLQGIQPSVFFRESLIEGELLPYIRFKLLGQPDYLSVLADTPILFFLYSRWKCQDREVRERGMDMLRCALEAGAMDLNEILDGKTLSTRWTDFIAQIAPWNMYGLPRGDADGSHDRIRHIQVFRVDLFQLLLEHGADPNALVFDGTIIFSPAWMHYLGLSTKLSRDESTAYFKGLRQFIAHGADARPASCPYFCELDGGIVPLDSSNLNGVLNAIKFRDYDTVISALGWRVAGTSRNKTGMPVDAAPTRKCSSRTTSIQDTTNGSLMKNAMGTPKHAQEAENRVMLGADPSRKGVKRKFPGA